MNYRHAFHAGNFADVLKHTVLVRVLLHLLNKETPFRVIETHAGAGVYDLAGDAATRTQEWRGGIGRLMAHPPTGKAGKLLEPYLALVRNENSQKLLHRYPGSPEIARALCRKQDRMIFCELHPDDWAALKRNLGGDRRTKAIEIDGWAALKAYLPPKERRGLVLIDPAFEEPNEFNRLVSGLEEAYRRWKTGIFLLWYPVKNGDEVRVFERRIAKLGVPKILRIEFSVGALQKPDALSACGLAIVNPPWMLEDELKSLLPALSKHLGRASKGRYRLDWLVP